MTTPTGQISLSDIQNEFGGSGQISLSEYYRGGSNVPGVGAGTSGIPTSSTISFSQLRGKSKTVSVTYDVLGGGGGGGAGQANGGGSGSAPSGGSSSVSGSGISTVTASGGSGGGNGNIGRYDNARLGASSAYGTGGAMGGLNTAGGNASGYGAGGGGGGGDAPGTFDSSGNAGSGGGAGQRLTGSFTAVYGTNLTISIGSGGSGSTAGNYYGGNGTGGRISLSWDGNSPVYTSSTTRQVN